MPTRSKSISGLGQRFLTLAATLLLVVSGCQKISPEAKQEPVQVQVFTNHTGSATAEGLQAQLIAPGKCTINLYGLFGADNTPSAIRSFTVQKAGNDTTVHFLLNQLTARLEMSYLDVKGAKQPLVIKYSYVAGSATAVRVGLYDYNWQTNTGVLRNETLLTNTNGTTSQTPIYATNRVSGSTSFNDLLVGIGGGVAIVEAVLYSTLGTGLIATYGPAFIAAVPGALPAAVVTGACVALFIATLEAARADDLEPDPSTAYPAGTPPAHSSTVPSAASLPASDCGSTNISFKVGMDSQGSILVYGVTGSTGPYSYAVNSQRFQTGEVFAGNYPDGSYPVFVRNGAGCIAGAVVSLKRSAPCNIPAATLQLLTGGSSKTWRLVSATVTASSGQATTYVPEPGKTLRWVVSADGQQQYDSWAFDDAKLLLRYTGSYAGTSLVLSTGDSICPQTSDSDIEYRWEKAPYVFTELTATKLVIKSVRTQPIVTVTMVAP